MQGVWGVSRGWVHVESSDDSTWKSIRAATTVDPPDGRGGGRTYKMSFPTKGGSRRCPVEGCPGTLTTRTAMRVHFVHRHVQDTVVVHVDSSDDSTRKSSRAATTVEPTDGLGGQDVQDLLSRRSGGRGVVKWRGAGGR